jgi:hypothetical protein
LGLAVIIVTFGVFVALPVLVPSLSELNCERIVWACGRRPIIYHTLIWNKPEPPDTPAVPGRLNIVPDADNTSLTISGYLLYGYEETGNSSGISLPGFVWIGGLPDRTIHFRYTRRYEENQFDTQTYDIITDNNGFFSLEVDIDDETICYFLTAIKDYEVINPRSKTLPIEIYMDSKASDTTCKGEAGIKRGIPWWVWLILAITIVVVGWLIYRYRKRRKKIEIPPEILPPAEEFETPISEEAEESESGGDITRLTISFPEIAENLPAVWGADEPLAVNIDLIDDSLISSQACEVEWGDGDIDQEIFSEDGRFGLSHTFKDTGEYLINASYKEDASGRTISSWRKIRIVDYREEMVRLFNEMLERLELTDISIGSEMTPREIEEILKPRLEGIDDMTMRRLISSFEEANYSTHPVTRDSYLAMYQAIREVIGGDI